MMPRSTDNLKLRWKDHTPLGCGTAIGWRRGCHCEECREWHRKSVSDWRAWQKGAEGQCQSAPHSSANGPCTRCCIIFRGPGDSAGNTEWF